MAGDGLGTGTLLGCGLFQVLLGHLGRHGGRHGAALA